jgi:hypothetical protein
MLAQAARAAKAVSSVTAGTGDRAAASDSFQTYMMMLLISAPLLIDESADRHFLERAQHLEAVMVRTLTAAKRPPDGAAVPSDGLDDAVQQLQSAAAPLLQPLSPEMRDSMQRIGWTAEEQYGAGTLGSFLFDVPEDSSRTQAPSLGWTSMTCSPAATSCWASRWARPPAPFSLLSFVHGRLDKQSSIRKADGQRALAAHPALASHLTAGQPTVTTLRQVSQQ